jgi:general secretion pathway protein D
MKKTLAILLLACACAWAQEEPTAPPPAPPTAPPTVAPPPPPTTQPPTLPSAPPTTTFPAPGVQPTRLPAPSATAGTTNTPEANAERLEALKRQFQERMATRSNATIRPAGAVPPTTRPLPAATPVTAGPGAAPAGGPVAAPAGIPAVPASPGAAPGAGSIPPISVPSDDNDVVTNYLRFPAVDLNTFLGIYADFHHRMILRPSGLPAQTITFEMPTGLVLTRREMIEAMDTVLSMNGISTILVGEKFVKVVTTADALTAAAPATSINPTNIPEAGQYMVRICQLKYVKPSIVAPLLTPFAKIPSGVVAIEDNGIVVLRDFAENVKRMLHIIELVDVAIPSEFISEVIPIKYVKASEIANALGNLGGGGGGATIGGSSSGSMGGNTMGGNMMGSGFGRSGMSGMGNRGMGSYGSGSRSGGYGSGYMPYGGVEPMASGTIEPMSVGSVQPMAVPGVPTVPGATTAAPGGSFSDRLRSIINKASGTDIQIIGPNKILADENSNQLLVFAGREDMKTIKDIISKLDTISPQVLIESLILEVSLNDGLQASFDYAYAKKGNGAIAQITKALPVPPPQDISGFGSNVVSGGLNWFGKVDDNFYYSVKAAAQDGRISVLSRPRIQTSHAQAASFFVGETRPYPTGTSYGGYGGNYSQIQQLNIGVTLNVLPLINQDGLVVLDIQQSITSFGGNVTIQNVGEVPITNERDASAKISVKSGETIVLGGFISANNSKNGSGIPILKDLPLLGFLFRATSTSKVRQELIILIRPTVLPNPSDAVLEAHTMKSKMPLVRGAEIELQEDWEKFQRAADDAEAASLKRKDKQAAKDAKKGEKYEYGPVEDLDMLQPAPANSGTNWPHSVPAPTAPPPANPPAPGEIQTPPK